MAKNYMADVAKMLGVELEEEFNLNNGETKYKFTENGFYFHAPDGWWQCSNVLLPRILRGNVKIVKLPWQPKDEEHYYFPAAGFQYSCPVTWRNSPIDFALKEAGMVFRTKEECEAALPALRKKYLGGDDNV
nr:MAG TPA: hypothetical protein [Caudoviricetes sp.]